jgi:ribosomal protein S3AE
MVEGNTNIEKTEEKLYFHEDQVAGHAGTIRFDGHKLYKICS